MRFFYFLMITLALSCITGAATEAASLYQQNKVAIEKAAKIYLAFEARHEIGPGADTDLKLPDKAKFRTKKGGTTSSWIYPVALGLEVKIGDPQRRIVVLAPKATSGRYFVATDDLAVQSFSKKDLQPIFDALEKRRAKLQKAPLN